MSEQGGVLALVTARGGSKSIPRKNLRPLAGEPLVVWSIAAALAARAVQRVVVSTDDPEIADVSRRAGAEVPFLRPSPLAEDDTPDLPVFEHALHWLDATEGYRPDLVVHLRPTSPLRPPGLLDEGIALMRDDPRAHSLRAMAPPQQNPFKMWRRSGRYVVPLLSADVPEPYNAPRQALPPTLWQTGHLDIARPATLLRRRPMTGVRVLPLLVDARYVLDIDTPEQWEVAEVMARSGAPLARPQAVRT